MCGVGPEARVRRTLSGSDPDPSGLWEKASGVCVCDGAYSVGEGAGIKWASHGAAVMGAAQFCIFVKWP